MTEKDLYQQIVEEISAGQLDQALWAMAWTKAVGDENKAKASYIEMRVAELKSQAHQTAKSATLDEWQNAFRTTQGLLWATICSILLVSGIYFFWCFRSPPNTGVVASIAAIIGFNFGPFLIGTGVFLSLHRTPRRAVKTASYTLGSAAVVMLILIGADTWKRFHPSSAYSYPVVMADGRHGAIDSDSPLTDEQLQAHLDGYNRMDAAETSEREAHPDGLPWSVQLGRGFLSPFQSAVRLFK